MAKEVAVVGKVIGKDNSSSITTTKEVVVNNGEIKILDSNMACSKIALISLITLVDNLNHHLTNHNKCNNKRQT